MTRCHQRWQGGPGTGVRVPTFKQIQCFQPFTAPGNVNFSCSQYKSLVIYKTNETQKYMYDQLLQPQSTNDGSPTIRLRSTGFSCS